jgi:thiopurine S-methyltransferase
MDARYWHQRWQENKLAFHNSETHPLLIQYFNKLSLVKGSRVFVPLCGKTLDIAWLLSNGYRVAGAELSEIAIEQLFAELGLKPEISQVGQLIHYSAENIDLFVGDIFHLSGKMLDPVDAVYDRAALVALPKEMRNRYTTHLMEITNKAPQLLIVYEYDQQLMEEPPFSINQEEINRTYRNSYGLTLMTSTDVSGGLKGKCEAKESLWLLHNS